MKLFVALSMLFVSVSAWPAMGQSGGDVNVYTDLGFTGCSLYEVVGQVNSVWVAHTLAPTGRGAKFRVITDWDALQLPTDYHGNFVVGDVYTGVEVSYPDYFNPAVPGCVPLPQLLAELRFMPMSATQCGPTIYVAPHPEAASGMIEVTDCSDHVYSVEPGEPVLVNGSQYISDPFDPGRSQGALGIFCMCDIVGAEPSTWGGIKSLYR